MGEERAAEARRTKANRALWSPRSHVPLGPNVAEDLPRYREWAERREATRLSTRRRADRPTLQGPELTVVLLVGPATEASLLRRCLDSLDRQSTGSWRLAVCMVGTPLPDAESVLGQMLAARSGGRVDVHHLPDAAEAEAVQGAVEASPSPAFVVLRGGDELAPDAVALLSEGLVDADVAYGDEDRIGDDGLASDPSLKPDWSPDLLLSCDYLGAPVAYRRAPVEAAGGVRAVAGDWQHDLALRVTEHTDRVAHVPEVLWHVRTAPAGTASPTPIEAALDRRREAAVVENGPLPGTWHVRRRLPSQRPSVTAIVPFRDAPVLLRTCVDSLDATTGDVDLELLLVDNGSEELETFTLLDRFADRPDVTVITDPRPFNWASLNNRAAESARGEVLLFLNNDIEALEPGWLGILTAHVLRASIGAAGARLLYPSGRVQHAGMVIGLGGAAGHVLAGLEAGSPGYLAMAGLTRDCSAVTGACMTTRRDLFQEVGGFDEALGLDLNDVDYCLRLRSRGQGIVYEPGAVLIHYESPSRGTSGSTSDQARFVERWEEPLRRGDPFLNAALTRADGSASLRRPHEEEMWNQWRANLKP